MRINVEVHSNSIGLQIFDALYAYRQSLDKEYKSDWEIVFDQPPNQDDFKVLFVSMPRKLSSEQVMNYDLVLMCNGGEPLCVATGNMTNLITLPHVYMIANSMISPQHHLYGKILSWPDALMQCRDYWSRYFYPMYFENHKNFGQPKKYLLTAINGANRVNRHWLFSELLPRIPNINIKNRYSYQIKILNDVHWITQEDRDFHHWINQKYNETVPEQDFYQPETVSIGMQEKFGEIYPGFRVIDEYWQSHCVIWPEQAWQNDEISITEKACKCFYTLTIPWPVGGANIHKLYEQQGFLTAWHLLPTQYQAFDSILCHEQRHTEMIKSMQWLAENFHSLDQHTIQTMLRNNNTRFLQRGPAADSVLAFSNLLEQHANK